MFICWLNFSKATKRYYEESLLSMIFFLKQAHVGEEWYVKRTSGISLPPLIPLFVILPLRLCFTLLGSSCISTFRNRVVVEESVCRVHFYERLHPVYPIFPTQYIYDPIPPNCNLPWLFWNVEYLDSRVQFSFFEFCRESVRRRINWTSDCNMSKCPARGMPINIDTGQFSGYKPGP